MMPGGPRNARQMQMMMRRLGMTSEEIDGVIEVIVRTATNEHHFDAPQVTKVSVQGTTTYQVVGTPKIRPRTASTTASGSAGTAPAPPPPAGPPEEDIALVMEQGGVDRSEAIAALTAANGEPAEAIMKLLSRRSGGGG